MSFLLVSSSSSSPALSPRRTTTRLLSFVKQNNQGLIFLRNGNIVEARKCFTEALRGAQIGLVVVGSGNDGATTAAGVSNHQHQNQQQQQEIKNSNGDIVAVPGGIAATAAAVTTTTTVPTDTTTATIRVAGGDSSNNNDTSSTATIHHEDGNRTTENSSTSSRKRKNSTTSSTTRATTTASDDTDTDTDADTPDIVFDFRQEFFSRLQTLPTTSRLQDQALSIFMEPSQLSCANMALIYAVIIYNMGLVYHVRGKQCQSDVLLRKAFDLYDNARTIVLVELSSSSSTHDDRDDDQEQEQKQDEYQNELPLPSSSSSRRRRRFSSSSSIDNTNTIHHHDHHCCRNPIVDLLRLSLLKQMADVQKSLSNIRSARILCDEITAFITSVVDQDGEFMYKDSRVTGLMKLQVGSFLMYAISLQQALMIAPAA